MPTPLLEDKPLLGEDSSQALLFRDDQIEAAVVAAEKVGRYTAARLKAKQPAAYDAIVGLLGLTQPPGLAEIGRLFGVHHKTVAAVRDSNPEPIDIARSKRVARLLLAGDLQVERMIENPESIPMQNAAFSASIAYEKAELLAGRATQRVETVDPINLKDQYEKLLETTRAKAREKQLTGDQVRVIESEIGLDGEKSLAIGAPATATAVPIGGDQVGADQPKSDSESDDNANATRAMLAPVTKAVTEQDQKVGSAAELEPDPPGGGSPAEPRPISPIHNRPTEFSGNRPSHPSAPAP